MPLDGLGVIPAFKEVKDSRNRPGNPYSRGISGDTRGSLDFESEAIRKAGVIKRVLRFLAGDMQGTPTRKLEDMSTDPESNGECLEVAPLGCISFSLRISSFLYLTYYPYLAFLDPNPSRRVVKTVLEWVRKVFEPNTARSLERSSGIGIWVVRWCQKGSSLEGNTERNRNIGL